MSLDEIVAALRDRVLIRVSEATGVSEKTVQQVASGKAKRPAKKTISRLSAYLSGAQ